MSKPERTPEEVYFENAASFSEGLWNLSQHYSEAARLRAARYAAEMLGTQDKQAIRKPSDHGEAGHRHKAPYERSGKPPEKRQKRLDKESDTTRREQPVPTSSSRAETYNRISVASLLDDNADSEQPTATSRRASDAQATAGTVESTSSTDSDWTWDAERNDFHKVWGGRVVWAHGSL